MKNNTSYARNLNNKSVTKELLEKIYSIIVNKLFCQASQNIKTYDEINKIKKVVSDLRHGNSFTDNITAGESHLFYKQCDSYYAYKIEQRLSIIFQDV